MWKICLVVLVAGTGTVVAFGFLLLGLKFANRLGTGGTRRPGRRTGGARLGGYVLALACAVIVRRDRRDRRLRHGEQTVMKRATTKSALVTPAGARAKLIASSQLTPPISPGGGRAPAERICYTLA